MDARVRAFLIFDRAHDADLRDRLMTQSLRPEAAFTIVADSEDAQSDGSGDECLREKIRDADEVIVMCSQNTDATLSVCAEFRIALDEEKPYLLLWGRRESMCTKPVGAKANDGIYLWAHQILDDRTREILRQARARDDAATRKEQSGKAQAASRRVANRDGHLRTDRGPKRRGAVEREGSGT
jgi:hypothetical protein